MYTYNAKLDRVVDGDTVDATVDLGFDTWKFIRIKLFSFFIINFLKPLIHSIHNYYLN